MACGVHESISVVLKSTSAEHDEDEMAKNQEQPVLDLGPDTYFDPDPFRSAAFHCDSKPTEAGTRADQC